MVQFLAPVFLFGLIGLSIPVLVHLWNTRDSKIIKVGNIRWFQESESVKVRRIKLTDIPLLLLRLAILLLIVLLMSDTRSAFFKTESKGINWVLIDPSLPKLSIVMDSIDHMKKEGWEVRFMQQGFPLTDEEILIDKNENFWSLLKELDLSDGKPDSVLVISQSNSLNFRGIKPVVNIGVNWVTIPMLESSEEPILALSIQESLLVYYSKMQRSNYILTQNMGAFETKIKGNDIYIYPSNSTENGVKVYELDSLRVKIVGVPNSYEYKNLAAAINTINAMSPLPIGISNSDSSQVVFNLTDSIWYEGIISFSTSPNEKLIGMLSNSISKVDKYYITKDFSIDNMLKYDFVEEIFFILNKNFKTTVRNARNLEMPLEVVQPQTEKFTTSIESDKLAMLSVPLWFFVIILLAIERIISFRRNQ